MKPTRLARSALPDRRHGRICANAADSGMLVIVVTHDLGLAARFADTVSGAVGRKDWSRRARPAEALSEKSHQGCVPDQRLSRGISARGRGSCRGLEYEKAISSFLSAAMVCAGIAMAGNGRGDRRVAAHRVDERLHRPIAADLGGPGANPRSSAAIRATGFNHGGWRCAPIPHPVRAAPKIYLCSGPMSWSRACSTKRSTRELLKEKGLHLAEFGVSAFRSTRSRTRSARWARSCSIRIRAGRRKITKLDAAICARRAQGGRATGATGCCRCPRRGWVSGSESLLSSLLTETGLFNAAGELGVASGGFRLAGGDRESKAGFYCGGPRAGDTAEDDGRGPSCCIPRSSGSIRRRNAIVIPDRLTVCGGRHAGGTRWTC